MPEEQDNQKPEGSLETARAVDTGDQKREWKASVLFFLTSAVSKVFRIFFCKKLTRKVKIDIILTKKVMECCLQKKVIMRSAS